MTKQNKILNSSFSGFTQIFNSYNIKIGMFGMAFRLYFHFNIVQNLTSKLINQKFQNQNSMISRILNNIIFRVNTQQGAIL
jgi:hypothetical protein